jgi:hypothetical protein
MMSIFSHFMTTSILLSSLMANSVAFAEPISDRFMDFVSGDWTNENQHFLAPDKFSFAESHHCRLTVTGDQGPRNAVLFQIGSEIQPRRRVFIPTLLSNGTLELASRRIKNESSLTPYYCSLPAASRTIDDALLDPAKCFVYYTYNKEKDNFEGSTAPEGCPSSFQGATSLHVRETVSANKLEIEEKWLDASGKFVAGSANGPYIYVKKPKFPLSSMARYSCWASLKKPDNTFTLNRAELSDNGGVMKAEVTDAQNQLQSFEVKLSRVSFSDTTPVLKLSVHQAGSEKSMFYVWAEPGAYRIGANVTWIQAGCTRIN